MSERDFYGRGERVPQNGEFWDDQDCGPNGHFVIKSATKEKTSNGTEIVFKEEQVSDRNDRPTEQPKVTHVPLKS